MKTIKTFLASQRHTKKMTISLDYLAIQSILSFLLAMFRIQGFFISAPIFSQRTIPVIVRIGLSGLFCFWFYETIFVNAHKFISTNIYCLVILIFCELIIGFAFGFVFNLIFDVIATVAQLLAMQVGENSANIFNPTIQASVSPTAILFTTITMLIFLNNDGLFDLAYILKKSFEIIPLADYNVNFDSILENFYLVFSRVFIVGLKFILPIVALMFVFDIFMAIFSKILPQANMFFLLMPIKTLLAALFMMMMMPAYLAGIQTFFNEEILEIFDQLFTPN